MASEAFVGGEYLAAPSPTGVFGVGYPSPGVASAPPAVLGGRAMRARHNRGSNARLPYTRIVPLQPREQPRAGPVAEKEMQTRTMEVDGKQALEYDGLREGELAWILGRRFAKMEPDDGLQKIHNNKGNLVDTLSGSQRYGHQAYAGQGIGVDRMQRLASTAWVESMMRTTMADAKVHLHALRLDAPYALAHDAGLRDHFHLLAGSTALYVTDLVHDMARIQGGEIATSVGDRKNNGICVLETGPFLRGVQVDHTTFKFEAAQPFYPATHMGRNSGDSLAFSALMLEIHRRNLLSWTPDGIVVSKLESPTDDPHTSIAMDARSAQTFNVAVQGPAITTAWTSDVKDTRLVCQPLDRVFVCLVADLSWKTNSAMDGPLTDLLNARLYVVSSAQRLREATKTGGDVPAALNNFKTAQDIAAAAADKFINTLPNDKTPYENQMETVRNAERKHREEEDADEKEKAKRELVDAQRLLDDMFQLGDDYETAKTFVESNAGTGSHPNDADVVEHMEMSANASIDALRRKQDLVRACLDGHVVSRAVLTNFRLMRSTSSHMTNYSELKALDPNSRCGLRIAMAKDLKSGVSEYIVGAWCIGSVADAAASRANNGAPLNNIPTNMTINVNVNVEWWDGDKLYAHFMDRSGLVLMRGKNPPRDKQLLSTDKDIDIEKYRSGSIGSIEREIEAFKVQQDYTYLRGQDELMNAPGTSKVFGVRVEGSRAAR